MKNVISIVVVVLFIGCNPLKRIPQPEVELPESFQNSTTASGGAIKYIEWWKNFEDTTLNNLVIQAIENNRDVAIIASKVAEARENIKISRGAMLPSFSSEFTAEGDYANSTKITQSYGITPIMNWQISLAGAESRKVKESKMMLFSEEFQYQYAINSLIAEVATTYFNILEYQGALNISRESYKSRATSAALIDSMVHYGLTSILELKQAESLKSTAAAAIPQYRRAIDESLATLSGLLGSPPISDRRFKDKNLSDVALPTIEVGIPSSIIEGRYDIQSSLYTLEAYRQGVGAAYAARFPIFTLTSAGGVASTVLKNLLAGDPFVWSGTAKLLQPIFSFGTLKATQKVAEQRYIQAMLDYENSVIMALSEVESALSGIATFSSQIKSYRDLVDANRAASVISKQLYDSGLADFLNYLDAERSLFDSELEYIELKSQQLINQVTLYKALR